MFSLATIEYDKFLHFIEEQCHSTIAQERVKEIKPLKDKEQIEKRLLYLEEIQSSIRNEKDFNFEGLSELQFLKEIELVSTFNFEEFREIYNNILVSNQVKKGDIEEREYPLLYERVTRIQDLTEIEKRFTQIFTPEGEVLDSASKTLFAIRKRQRNVRDNIIQTLQTSFRDTALSNYFQDKIITQRDDRYVIPVKEGAQTFITGILHGRSSSRSTIYLEPKEVVEKNNELNTLQSDEKEEIYRIFCEYTEQILLVRQQVLNNTELCIQMDLAFATARLCNELHAKKPIIRDDSIIKIIAGRHPLLIKRLGEVHKVIPFNLELGEEHRILIISGPNTGGKTITLKAVGLLSALALSGIPIPADTDTEIGLLDSIIADIGDNQSLESSLSTFSAHIATIYKALSYGNKKSLILIDEIGSATDPEQGSALAQSILEQFVQKDVLGIITTHYTSLKVFAEASEVCVNASMQFDPKSLMPTYQFKPGFPGNSFAIEIASNLGLDKEVIERARELSGKQNLELTELLYKMAEEKKKLSRSSYEYELKGRLIDAKVSEYEQKMQRIDEEKKQIRKKALGEAKEYLIHLQKKMNGELEQIENESKKDKKEKIKRMHQEIHQMIAEAGKEEEEIAGIERKQVKKLEVGQAVWVSKFDTKAIIAEIYKESAKVDMNGILFTVPLQQLYYTQTESEPVSLVSKQVVPARSVKFELNVIGLLFDEALPLVEEFLDDAVYNGFNKVRIVHGKGTGALRTKIRQYLKKCKQVQEFYSPTSEAGGDGVTVVSFIHG